MSRLDIAEKRRPQDGRFRIVLEKDGQAVNVDFRVSIIPGYHGENVVLRMLDPRAAPRSIETLGLAPAVTIRLAGLLRATAGLILVTGPTGSGKSTTLFGVLRTLYHGYSGRTAVAELWMPSDEDAVLINMRAPFDQIRRSAARTTIPMAADVWTGSCAVRPPWRSWCAPCRTPASASSASRRRSAAPGRRRGRPVDGP